MNGPSLTPQYHGNKRRNEFLLSDPAKQRHSRPITLQIPIGAGPENFLATFQDREVPDQ